MHRRSGEDIPDAPITHHWLDSSHITFGVVTFGAVFESWKLETSFFTGREPDQHRYDFEEPRFDSYAARVSLMVAVTVWRPQSIGARVLAAVVGGLGLYEFIHVFTAISDVRAEAGGFGALVSVAFGAYVAFLAALSLVAWAAVTQFKRVSA